MDDNISLRYLPHKVMLLSEARGGAMREAIITPVVADGRVRLFYRQRSNDWSRYRPEEKLVASLEHTPQEAVAVCCMLDRVRYVRVTPAMDVSDTIDDVLRALRPGCDAQTLQRLHGDFANKSMFDAKFREATDILSWGAATS